MKIYFVLTVDDEKIVRIFRNKENALNLIEKSKSADGLPKYKLFECKADD